MKALIAWPLMLVVVAVDVITKAMAVSQLPPNGDSVPVFGDAVRFALVYNPGAAFGLYLGSYSRWIFMALTIGALIILRRLYVQCQGDDRVRALAIAMVASGAVGNLIDRLRTELGVVDFIDVGYGLYRWPTFNVADMAVSGGAFLLAWVLWREAPSEAPVQDAANDGSTVIDSSGTP